MPVQWFRLLLFVEKFPNVEASTSWCGILVSVMTKNPSRNRVEEEREKTVLSERRWRLKRVERRKWGTHLRFSHTFLYLTLSRSFLGSSILFIGDFCPIYFLNGWRRSLLFLKGIRRAKVKTRLKIALAVGSIKLKKKEPTHTLYSLFEIDPYN